MSTKKAVRKQKAERALEPRRSRRRSALTLLVFVLVAAFAVLAAALIFGPGDRSSSGDLIWSPEHGHYHRR